MHKNNSYERRCSCGDVKFSLRDNPEMCMEL